MRATASFCWLALTTAGLLLGACASATGPTPSGDPMVSTGPMVPAQVSSLAWEQDMQRFAAADAAKPPAKGAVLFIGSSSIRLWDTLARDFPEVEVINRGFGGSEIRDSTWYARRIVVPHAPCHVIVYAGDNDLHSGRSPGQLVEDFRAFVEGLRNDLPAARITYIANKPSPARASLMDAQQQANDLVKVDAARMRDVHFIDVFGPMIGAHGQPREELYLDDRLHLNRAGYDLWRTVIGPHVRCP